MILKFRRLIIYMCDKKQFINYKKCILYENCYLFIYRDYNYKLKIRLIKFKLKYLFYIFIMNIKLD